MLLPQLRTAPLLPSPASHPLPSPQPVLRCPLPSLAPRPSPPPAPRPLPTAPWYSGVDPAREPWIQPLVPQSMSDPVRKEQSGGGSCSGGEREPGIRWRRRALDRSSSAGGTSSRGRHCTHRAKLELTLEYKLGSEKASALNTYAVMKSAGSTGPGADIDAGRGDLGGQGAPPPPATSTLRKKATR